MLEVDGIDVYYGQLPAVRDVSLSLPDGGILAVIGANGAGKSTLLKAIAGQIPVKSGRIVLGLSSPLGIEDLPPEQAAPLLAAWHDGVARLRPDFDAWASVAGRDPDLTALRQQLAQGFVGLQIPATALAGPADVERLGEVLALVQAADRPVFVHPGPVPAAAYAATSAFQYSAPVVTEKPADSNPWRTVTV